MRNYLHLLKLSILLALVFPTMLLQAQEELSDLNNITYNYKEIERPANYVGIGIVVEKERDYPYMHVRKVLRRGPAFDAGLRKGDKVVKIDGESVVRKSLEEIAEMMLGIENSILQIEYMRDHKFYVVTVERKHISF